jgi:hypothetical protein
MTTYTEGRHSAEFILSEASGGRSREEGTLAASQTISAGELLMLSGTTLVEYDGETASTPVGIAINAHTTAAGVTESISYIARDAEVNGNLLTYPDLSSGKEDADVLLADLGIIVRGG